MKRVINGKNIDTTTSVIAWLKSINNPMICCLYLIGEVDDPDALFLTDWDSPLRYSLYGTFWPAVISRAQVPNKIGFEVAKLQVSYSPKSAPTQSMATADPYQRAQESFYDDWPMRIWNCYMPTRGDANTYGCSELFGGRIGDTEIDRGEIRFACTSFLDVVNQMVPAQVIEITNPMAAATGAVPPPGMSQIPQFNVIAGSTQTELICDCTWPDAHHLFADDSLHNGFIVFNKAPGATLGGQWSGIQNNRTINVGGNNYNAITLYARMPFAPTPGSDTFYLSGKAPVNQGDQGADYYGFPYLPMPESSI